MAVAAAAGIFCAFNECGAARKIGPLFRNLARSARVNGSPQMKIADKLQAIFDEGRGRNPDNAALYSDPCSRCKGMRPATDSEQSEDHGNIYDRCTAREEEYGVLGITFRALTSQVSFGWWTPWMLLYELSRGDRKEMGQENERTDCPPYST